MSSSNDVGSALEVALLVAAAIESIGCEYFIGGSVASSLQGEPRATNDIDFVVAILPHQVRALAERLGPDFGGRDLDHVYLKTWADRLQLSALLSRASSDARTTDQG